MEIKKVYCDMDGVISDFDGWKAKHGGITKENLWREISKVDHFFFNLEPMEEAFKLMEYLESLKIPIAMLTALPLRSSVPDAKEDKRKWMTKYFDSNIEFNCVYSAIHKQKFSGPGLVLIDDNKMNIEQWIRKDGSGIYYTNFDALQKSMERLLKRK